MKNNPYYIEKRLDLTSKQLVYAKQNNYYIFKALNFIFGSVETNEAKVGGPYRAPILTGNLRNDDSLTGIDSNGLGKKLKFLTIALGNPKYVEQFKKSFLHEVLLYLFSGSLTDPDSEWRSYLRTPDCEELFKNKGCLESAIICNRDNINSPLGIDFSKIIDIFVKTDKNGNFYLDDKYSAEEEVFVTEAVDREIKTLKSNDRFRNSFINPNCPQTDD